MSLGSGGLSGGWGALADVLLRCGSSVSVLVCILELELGVAGELAWQATALSFTHGVVPSRQCF